MSEQWRNPPVFYALAQVQFNAIAEQRFAGDVQEAFRKAGFPDAVKEESLVLTVTAAPGSEEAPSVSNQATARRSYMNARRTEGFVWLSNALTYHTTDYQTFEHFRARFILGLETLSQVTAPDYVTRVGARYMDLVRPKDSKSLDQYLVREVLGLSSQLQGRGHAMSEAIVTTPPTTLISRVFISDLAESQPRPPMPHELLPVHLEMKPAFQNISGRAAVLDTDCFEAISREPFDKQRIGECLGRVKGKIQETFDAIITPNALKEWQ